VIDLSLLHTTLAQAADAATAAPAAADRTPLVIIGVYMLILFGLGIGSSLLFRGSSSDFFVASRSIGPFMLLMSLFGTTMTAFALVGSTGKAFSAGIGTYGLMASSSGLIHAACFFLIGIKMWAAGKRYGYVTQIQYFRDRYQSQLLGYVMFPILVGLIIPYLLVGLIGAGSYISGLTKGMFPVMFETASPVTNGAVPPWLTGMVICVVVLFYVFFGGVRSAVWANTFQTIVFMIMGLVGFTLIAKGLGGAEAAYQMVVDSPAKEKLSRGSLIEPKHFMSYMLIPLSVGMFPHLFQHWLTARSAKAFRLTVIAHPIFIMIVWVPCILIGVWAAGLHANEELFIPPKPGPDGTMVPNANTALSMMVAKFIEDPLIKGLFSAGVLAAIMSSLDSQFVCVGSMFTNDFALPLFGKDKFTDKQKVLLGRGFIIAIVVITYLISLGNPTSVFNLGVWCFSGFSALFPIVFAAVYWKGATKAGVFACIIVTVVTWVVLITDNLLVEAPRFGHIHGTTGEYLVQGMMPVTFIFAASAITLVVVSLVTPKLPDAVIQKFFDPKAKADA
jgi:SSS family solute:Na+ symporter